MNIRVAVLVLFLFAVVNARSLLKTQPSLLSPMGKPLVGESEGSVAKTLASKPKAQPEETSTIDLLLKKMEEDSDSTVENADIESHNAALSTLPNSGTIMQATMAAEPQSLPKRLATNGAVLIDINTAKKEPHSLEVQTQILDARTHPPEVVQHNPQQEQQQQQQQRRRRRQQQQQQPKSSPLKLSRSEKMSRSERRAVAKAAQEQARAEAAAETMSIPEGSSFVYWRFVLLTPVVPAAMLLHSLAFA
jgi:hypothetical protein